MKTTVKRAQEHDALMAKLKAEREEHERKHEEYLTNRAKPVLTEEEREAIRGQVQIDKQIAELKATTPHSSKHNDAFVINSD